MTEKGPKRLVPLAAGGTLTVEPTDTGFQIELWFTDREAMVSIPLTREEAGKFSYMLNDALKEQ